jgi:hypothetical protein
LRIRLEANSKPLKKDYGARSEKKKAALRSGCLRCWSCAAGGENMNRTSWLRKLHGLRRGGKKEA